MKKLFQILAMISISLSLNSCYYDSIYEPIDDGNGPGTEPGEELTYTNDIAPIFGFCSNCHNGSQKPDLSEENAYNSLVPEYVIAFNAEESRLYIKLNDEGHQYIVIF